MNFCKALLIGMAFSASAAWARPEVLFPKEVEVSNTGVISVFQVAELKELSGAAFAEIARFPLIDRVEKQVQFVLSGSEVSKKLRQLMKSSETLQRVNPSFRIPSEITIKIRQDGISKSEIERSLKNVLISRCEKCSFDINIKSIPKVKTQKYEIDWDGDLKGGSFMIPVRESDLFTNKWITGTVKVQKSVPVARRFIRFGERIQMEDVEMADSNITYIKEDSPLLNQVIGLIANKSLSAKAPVILSDLRREPAARKGQVLKALIGSSDFEVSINALAEENGFIGDVIKIKNSETQKTMSGTVVEKGVVKVQ